MNNFSNSYPAALPPIASPVIKITDDLLNKVAEMSRNSPRKRIIFPFHKTGEESIHRMLNGIQPNSYIQPHRHQRANKAEGIILLRGSIAYFTFDEEGKISEQMKLTAGTTDFGVDTEPHIYHSFLALEKDTVIYEVKPGPYNPELDKDFANWAPTEGTEAAKSYLQNLYNVARTMS